MGTQSNIRPFDEDLILNERDFITKAAVTATIFSAGQAATEVYHFSRNKDTRPTADSIFLTANVPWTQQVSLDTPVTALVTLEAVVDYLANDSQDGTGTDRTSSLTARW